MRPPPRCCERAIEAKGVEVVLQRRHRARSIGEGRAEGARTDGRAGASRPTSSSCAVGIRANADLARRAPASHVNRGIVVDDGLATSIPGIYAIGECAEHRGICYGLVEPALRAGARAGRAARGRRQCAYPGSVLATNLKVSGVNVFSAGDFSAGRACRRPRLHGRGGRRSTAAA